MHFACQISTSIEILDLLISRGGDINRAVGDKKWTPLHYLAWANHDREMLCKVVYRGAFINAKGSDGISPIIIAALKRAPEEFIRTMLELGADPSFETVTNRNAIFYLKHTIPVSSPGDIRLILLDPKIRQNQILALAFGLHQRIGGKSQIRRLSSDLLRIIREFLKPDIRNTTDQ